MDSSALENQFRRFFWYGVIGAALFILFQIVPSLAGGLSERGLGREAGGKIRSGGDGHPICPGALRPLPYSGDDKRACRSSSGSGADGIFEQGEAGQEIR